MASSAPPSPASVLSDTDILTPSRKVKALLAQFDDSDASEDEAPQQNAVSEAADRDAAAEEESSNDSDEDVPVALKSRMAARLEVSTKPAFVRAAADDTPPAHPAQQSDAAEAESQDDEAIAPIRRRLLTKRKSSPALPSSPPTTAATTQPPSPMFFPSPTRSQRSNGRRQSVQASEDEEQLGQQSGESKSRFMALVEKQRKMRAEKEAAEEAKRAARRVSSEAPPSNHKRQRGSSPGDDSHESSEGSDADAARQIAKRAKPTRKASKRAVEEMKRETQRLSRNTQLAHQAKTKKKFTIADFVTSFNSGKRPSAQSLVTPTDKISGSSSVAASDSERSRRHTTPPTSPIREPTKESTAGAVSSTIEPELVQEAPSLSEIGLEAVVDSNKDKGKADAPLTAASNDDVAIHRVEIPAMAKLETAALSPKAAKRKRLSELLRDTRASSVDYAEDDLDIVTAKGDRRKFAAFENLPKHKAKETPSHLALRTLANLNSKEKDKKSSMTAAEMQANLRRAAGVQARAEREQKLDELRARGVVIQTAEERDRDQQEVEDLVEKARQEAAEISKREKERAKKDGTFVKDALDDDDSDDDDDDEDFAESEEEQADSEDEESEGNAEDGEDEDELANEDGKLFDDQADDEDSEEEAAETERDVDDAESVTELQEVVATPAVRKARVSRVLSDDEDEAPQVATPKLPAASKTPQTALRSNRKQIPGLQMSDDLPLGLTQAFDATMADSQSQPEPAEEQDSMDYVGDLPSPGLAMMPRLNRLESLDLVTDSQPATQTQPLNISLSFSQSQIVPESPSLSRQIQGTQATPSQAPFEPTQDGEYLYSPFHGNRFTAETPTLEPHSTIDTIPLHDVQASPVVMRKGRLRRGHATEDQADEAVEETAFEIMKRAAKKAEQETFDKTKSKAKDIVDEAAEESDDEYAGLGGASDDENNDVENEDDRKLIDDDTQVGKGDEAALAGFYADRERKSDEAAVNKLYQEIKTGKLRNRRGGNGELDLSDEEDAAARRRESKRREFAKMRRELLKDEAVGKIAEDKKKEAFLRSLEDRPQVSDDDDDLDASETQDLESQNQQPQHETSQVASGVKRKRPLDDASESQLNRLPPALRRSVVDKKPSTLAEIQESLSFLIEGDSQTGTATLDLSDSEDEPEKYVNLDRHIAEAEADENADEDEAQGLGDFIVNDEEEDSAEDSVFKRPLLPSTSLSTSRSRLEATASTNINRRSRGTVINRLSTLQRASSSSSATSKMAFVSSTTASTATFKVPSLLRRATTNSSLSSLSSSTESRSATGVTIAKTERGHVSEEKVFVRKGMGGRRNAVNYQAGERPKQLAQQQRGGVGKRGKRGASGGKAKGKQGGFLGDLLGRADTWG